MILVTGAAGKTGRHVVSSLADAGSDVRALVRSPEQREPLLALGAREVLPGDLLSAADVLEAMDAVQAVYHICPNVHPREVEIGELAIGTAIATGVDRFVFHSVLYPDVEAMPHHWLKFQAEQKLRESGLAFTILRPCAYMQNVLALIGEMEERGRLEVPYDVGAELSVVDLRDVAAAAATVLSESRHEGRTYELCGPERLSHSRMARTLESALGRSVEAVAVDPSAWERKARSSGLANYAIDALLKMFSWYDRNGFSGSPKDLEDLLARRPSSFAGLVRQEVRRTTL